MTCLGDNRGDTIERTGLSAVTADAASQLLGPPMAATALGMLDGPAVPPRYGLRYAIEPHSPHDQQLLGTLSIA